MLYTKTITSPAGGSADNPTLDRIYITRGLIYLFEVMFPPGPCGLLKIRIEDGSAPLYPSTPGEWLYGDNYSFAFEDRYFVQTPDQALQVWHYNEDEAFNHTVQIKIAQVLDDAFIASFVPGYGQLSIAEALAQLSDAQAGEEEARKQGLIDYFARQTEGLEE